MCGIWMLRVGIFACWSVNEKAQIAFKRKCQEIQYEDNDYTFYGTSVGLTAPHYGKEEILWTWGEHDRKGQKEGSLALGLTLMLVSGTDGLPHWC